MVPHYKKKKMIQLILFIPEMKLLSLLFIISCYFDGYQLFFLILISYSCGFGCVVPKGLKVQMNLTAVGYLKN